MKTPKTLEEKRDELATNHAYQRMGGTQSEYHAFQTGFDAALSALGEGVEFDEKSFDAVFQPEFEGDEFHKGVEEGARWQFEQMKAQVGLAKQKAKEEFLAEFANISKQDPTKTTVSEVALYKRIQQLERELQELKGINDVNIRLGKENENLERELGELRKERAEKKEDANYWRRTRNMDLEVASRIIGERGQRITSLENFVKQMRDYFEENRSLNKSEFETNIRLADELLAEQAMKGEKLTEDQQAIQKANEEFKAVKHLFKPQSPKQRGERCT